MMRAKTGCMRSHNLEVGMNNSSMNDFVTSKERLRNPGKFKDFGFEVFIVIVLVFAIGSLQSWH